VTPLSSTLCASAERAVQMKIDIQVPVTASVDARQAAAEAERAGYAGLWTSEMVSLRAGAEKLPG
jgi:alkanesulfonate monooxygenase SsuD/methylene tetrahydromethanopterin reductase-like flavin-dependent oxidoreductase (luciferase family)